MMLRWTTICSRCGPIIEREPQQMPLRYELMLSWCAKCGSPLNELMERLAVREKSPTERGDVQPPQPLPEKAAKK